MDKKFHHLKIETCFLESVLTGCKTCEIRKNDRDFQAGDKILFVENFSPSRHVKVEITHVLHWPEGLKDGYVALSIRLQDKK